MENETAEALTEQLRARWQTTAGQPIRARVDAWTVEVGGQDGSQGWPQPTPVQVAVTLWHRDGTGQATSGSQLEGLRSWEDFAAVLVDLDEKRQGREALEQIAGLGKRYNDDRRRLDRSTERLKQAVQTAYAKAVPEGSVTRYRLAQEAGVPQTTIHRWLD